MLIDQRLLHVPYHSHSDTAQCIGVIEPDDPRMRQNRVVRIDCRGVARCLLDSLHFFSAPCMVDWTDHNGLSNNNVPCAGQMCLEPISASSHHKHNVPNEAHLNGNIILNLIESSRGGETAHRVGWEGRLPSW